MRPSAFVTPEARVTHASGAQHEGLGLTTERVGCKWKRVLGKLPAGAVLAFQQTRSDAAESTPRQDPHGMLRQRLATDTGQRPILTTCASSNLSSRSDYGGGCRAPAEPAWSLCSEIRTPAAGFPTLVSSM